MAIFEHKVECKLAMVRCQWSIWGPGTPLILQIRNLEHLGGQLGPLAVPHSQGSHYLVHHEVSPAMFLPAPGWGRRGGERLPRDPEGHVTLGPHRDHGRTIPPMISNGPDLLPEVHGEGGAHSEIISKKINWKLFSLALWNSDAILNTFYLPRMNFLSE